MRPLYLIFILGFSLVTEAIHAAPASDGTIIYVSRKLRMSSSEGAPPRDFYIDLGQHQGLKLGDILTVTRVQPILNGVTGDSNNFIRVVLGEIKVTMLGEFSSIARVLSHTDPNELPVMDYPGFMLGDVVKPKSSLPFDGGTP